MHQMTVPVLALAGLTLLAGAADARSWKFTPDAHSQTQVSFTSDASIVKFSGRSTQLEGQGAINIQDPAKSPTAELKVQLSSLDTGIGLRNEHMLGVTQAAKYPTVSFKLTSLKAPKLVANKPVAGTVSGDFTLHGVTRSLTAPVTLTYLPERADDKDYRPGDWVAVSTGFKLKLSDYQIALPPAVLGVKIADELGISFDAMAKAVD